jgi:hypothetical protein
MTIARTLKENSLAIFFFPAFSFFFYYCTGVAWLMSVRGV